MNDFSISEARIEVLGNRIIIDGSHRRIEPRVMKVLVCLAEQQGRVVPRETLLDRAWDGEAAGDEALTKAVSHLRKALDDSDRGNRIIETVPKVGYRLARPVVEGRRNRPYGLRPTRVGWLWGAVAVLSALLVVQWTVGAGPQVRDSNISNGSRQEVTAVISGLPAEDVRHSITSLAALSLPDSVLANAKAIRIRRIECPISGNGIEPEPACAALAGTVNKQVAVR